MIYEESEPISKKIDSGYNKYTESLDQPYPICDRCLEFINLMKSKTEDAITYVINLAMVEAFDQGFKRGFRASDKEKEEKSANAKDISKAYDTGYADGLKEGEKLGIEECDNAIIYMTKNFKTGDYVNMFGYTRLDYVLEEYSMSDIIDKVAQHITINETAEAQFNKLVKDIASKFNVPVETAKNIIKEYTSRDDDTKSTE